MLSYQKLVGKKDVDLSNGRSDIDLVEPTYYRGVSAVALPDPRDSIIIESKFVQFGVGSPATVVRVYITNKDTLGAIGLCLVEKSISGGAYMILSQPRTFQGVVNQLIPTLPDFQTFVGNRYNNVSPDSFAIASYRIALAGEEPPNLTRKAIYEIKFDTVRTNSNNGKVVIDTCRIIENWTSLCKPNGEDIKVNFVKGTITVSLADVPAKQPKWYDMNLDGSLDAADAVLLLNCVYLGEGECSGATSSDVVKLLNSIYRETSAEKVKEK